MTWTSVAGVKRGSPTRDLTKRKSPDGEFRKKLKSKKTKEDPTPS